MLKKLYKILPYLMLALGIAILACIIDGLVSKKMMLILDYALEGDIGTMKEKVPELLIFATSLVPLGILVAMTNNLYKRKANVLFKKYYVKKVFNKNSY